MNNTEQLFLGADFDADSTEPINFLETRLNDLSPFSAHEVAIDGYTYKTAEHAYQALRAVSGAKGAIVNARSPMDAWRAGQAAKQNGQLLSSYDKEMLMERIFRAKLEQHEDIKAILLLTGSRPLLKVYAEDDFWGTGRDGTGQNRMGKLWMRLRDELQEVQ